MSGERRSRQEIAEEADVVVTNVNRVLSVLEEAGASFERTVGDDGHQVEFRLRSIGSPKRRRAAPQVGSDARIVGASQVGEDIMVDFEVEGVRWRGKLMSPNRNVPFGKQGVVRAVEGDSLDALMATINVDGKHLPLAYIIPVGV